MWILQGLVLVVLIAVEGAIVLFCGVVLVAACVVCRVMGERWCAVVSLVAPVVILVSCQCPAASAAALLATYTCYAHARVRSLVTRCAHLLSFVLMAKVCPPGVGRAALWSYVAMMVLVNNIALPLYNDWHDDKEGCVRPVLVSAVCTLWRHWCGLTERLDALATVVWNELVTRPLCL